VCVAGGRPVPSMTKQLSDQRQSLARHDGQTCSRMAKVVQAQSAELRIRAHRPPSLDQGLRCPPFGILRKQERIRISSSRQGLDVRPRSGAMRHRPRAGLRIAQVDGAFADDAPAEIEHLTPATAGERQQPDRVDRWGHSASGAASARPSRASSSVFRNRAILRLGLCRMPRQGWTLQAFVGRAGRGMNICM